MEGGSPAPEDDVIRGGGSAEVHTPPPHTHFHGDSLAIMPLWLPRAASETQASSETGADKECRETN